MRSTPDSKRVDLVISGGYKKELHKHEKKDMKMEKKMKKGCK